MINAFIHIYRGTRGDCGMGNSWGSRWGNGEDSMATYVVARRGCIGVTGGCKHNG